MVLIRIIDSKTLTLELNPKTTTVHTLKLEIEHKLHKSLLHQCLILPSSRLLSDDHDSMAISQLGIGRNSTLILHVPFFGGMQHPIVPKPRLEFLNTKPLPNYVAGLGRGATGFTTRSDIGLTRAAPDLPDLSATTISGAAAGSSGAWRGRGKGGAEEENEEGDEEKGYDENQKFDEFEGNDVGLFASAEYDEDDKEADAMWEAIDTRMDLRRKDKREAKLKQEIKKYKASNPKITEQFADLKRKLYTLSVNEWDKIPEIGDCMALKYRMASVLVRCQRGGACCLCYQYGVEILSS